MIKVNILKGDRVMRFKILHTNDVHSRFENFARITTKIKELKDENTLILDAGDYHDFKDVMLQGTMGKAGPELLLEAGYDAIVIGNNEGFEGLEILDSITIKHFFTFWVWIRLIIKTRFKRN